MTKKDYVLIASAINEAMMWGGEEQKDGVRLTAQFIETKLEANNDRFDCDRFLTACGITN